MVMQKHLWNVFWGICVLIALVAAVRAWNLRFLYVDQHIREQSQIALEAVAQREGWLISDMSVQTVTRNSLVIHHRQHVRGSDPTVCQFIAFDSHALSPCDL
jgi:hypothetical protein